MPTQTFHVSDEQRDILNEMASLAGVSVGAWIKGVLFQKDEVPGLAPVPKETFTERLVVGDLQVGETVFSEIEVELKQANEELAELEKRVKALEAPGSSLVPSEVPEESKEIDLPPSPLEALATEDGSQDGVHYEMDE
jgi:hypothetical protein